MGPGSRFLGQFQVTFSLSRSNVLFSSHSARYASLLIVAHRCYLCFLCFEEFLDSSLPVVQNVVSQYFHCVHSVRHTAPPFPRHLLLFCCLLVTLGRDAPSLLSYITARSPFFPQPTLPNHSAGPSSGRSPSPAPQGGTGVSAGVFAGSSYSAVVVPPRTPLV